MHGAACATYADLPAGERARRLLQSHRQVLCANIKNSGRAKLMATNVV
jgi:hypothetical protein